MVETNKIISFIRVNIRYGYKKDLNNPSKKKFANL